MNKVILKLFLISTLFTYAQNSIFVTVTGSCNLMTHEYNYNGILNGKNDYTYNFSDSSGNFTFHISFNGVKWVSYVDNSISELSFYNDLVNDNLLPPNTGWVANICSNGTLEINDGNTSELTDFYTNSFKIYPNPIINYFNVNSNYQITKISIYTILGKEIKLNTTITQNNADISRLKKGVYFVKIDFNNQSVIKKIIKW